MRRLLVLRPEPGASATIERALGHGLNAVSLPLFKIEAVPWEAPDPARFDALLLTSANAVRFGGPQLDRLRILPVAAVGEATAQAARDAGFEAVNSGNEGVETLLGSIEPGLRLLHLCGEHRRVPGGQRQVITPVVVYRARAIDSPDLGAAAGSVALIHSPRAGERFAALTEAAGIDKATIAIAAISPAAADAAGDGWGLAEAAEAPNEEALLALAARLCNKPDGQ